MRLSLASNAGFEQPRERMMSGLVVVMPVYNNSPGLIKSLNSLVHESCSNDFDVLLVDDSPAPNLHCLDYSIYPFKVQVLTNGRNLGVTQSLNRALEWITKRNYALIARLDAGDSVVPGRFHKQRTHLETHADCVLIGGAVDYVTPEGQKLYTFSPPIRDDELRRKMHMNNYIAHPAAMMRLSAVLAVGGYRQAYPAAEDYDLFLRLAQIGKIANLSDVILQYEISHSQISLRKRRRQLQSRLLIQLNHFDGSQIESYLGLATTTLAFAIPWKFIIWLKSMLQDIRAVA